MRTLFWTSAFWPKIGGVEVLASQLLPALQARGHEFAVITPRFGCAQEDQTRFGDIPVHRFSFTDLSLFRDIDTLAATRKRISEIKREFRPDLVHVNAIDASIFFHLTTWHEHPAPTLVTLHGRWNDLTGSQNSLISRTLGKARWVVGCSKSILDYGCGFAPGIESRSSVIYNGIRSPTTAIEPLNFNPPTVLCLGRLVVEKGIDIALSAFASLSVRYPTLRVLIAGDGEARADLERQAAGLGLGNVEFLGWVSPDRALSLINRAAIVVMPSRQESFPLAALEAGQIGRPMVATRVGGLPEMIKHGETGMLTASEDAGALGEAIAALLDNPERAYQLGQAARERILQRFGWNRHIDAYDQLYRDLVADGRMMG